LFETLTDSFRSSIKKLRFKDDEKALKKAIAELRKALLKSDVHYKVVKELVKNVEIDTKQNGIGRDTFLNSLQARLEELLDVGGKKGFVYSNTPPTVVLMCGLQGSGKTTTTGKLASYLKQRKQKVLVAACDLQRLAAVEQLRQIAEQVEVDFFSVDDEKNPVKIAKAAKDRAKEGYYDVLIVDTAGRLAIDEELMRELKEIKNSIAPDDVFYVADALSGQDGLNSANSFKEQIDTTGIILSKFDSDSKGGIAISVANQTQTPLRFIGIGEKMADFEAFLPDRIVGRIMGSGDIATLAEKTSAVIDEKEAKRVTKKLKKGEFNFVDFLDQLENIKKLGNLQSLMGMIPGMQNMAGALKDVDLENSGEIKKIKAMVASMTKKEKENPSLLNASRKRRIAKGAGLDVMEINKIIKQFNGASKMAKKFSGKKGMQDLMSMMGQGQQNFPR
jgi:signal recognition particle subunit SRP54